MISLIYNSSLDHQLMIQLIDFKGAALDLALYHSQHFLNVPPLFVHISLSLLPLTALEAFH